MTYRELLELYKTGELELEQRKKVEKDIERQEAISDYLYEQEDILLIPSLHDKKEPSHYLELFLALLQSLFAKNLQNTVIVLLPSSVLSGGSQHPTPSFFLLYVISLPKYHSE